MAKNNIVPAVGTDDEVTRKNSTISSRYFGYGGGHLLRLWRCFLTVAKSGSSISPGQGLHNFFKIPNLPSLQHLRKMSVTFFSIRILAGIGWRRNYGKSLSRCHVLIFKILPFFSMTSLVNRDAAQPLPKSRSIRDLL